MYTLRNLALLSTLTACATLPKPVPAAQAPLAPPIFLSCQVASLEPRKATPPPKFDPAAFAADTSSAGDCAQEAARLRPISADLSWEALRACVDYGKFPRGRFTAIAPFLTGPWTDDLARRTDAPSLVALLIALRGDDVDADLATFHSVRVPAFSLTTAFDQPELYQGQMVIFRARSDDFHVVNGKATLDLEEMAEKTVQVYHQFRTRGSGSFATGVSEGSDEQNARWNPTSTWRGTRTDGFSRDRDLQNVTEPTGRHIVGQMQVADRFLEQHKEYVFLGRFDGLRTDSQGANVGNQGVVTISGYFEPSPLMMPLMME